LIKMDDVGKPEDVNIEGTDAWLLPELTESETAGGTVGPPVSGGGFTRDRAPLE
jgi:hypothetical protein